MNVRNLKSAAFVLGIFIISTITAVAQQKTGTTYRVFYLGGQSNMEGFGYVKDLPSNLSKPFKDAFIFDGNRVGDGEANGGAGKWEALRPGHGTGFTSDGTTNTPSDRFGVELTFAKHLQELFPNDKIAIIKYARNGSSIDSLAAGPFGCWEPDFKGKNGISQYDNFLSTITNAMKVKDIDGDGKEDTLIPAGILWMQGEGDASFTEAVALEYYDNLKMLMNLIRAALRKDDLPVVIGKISDSGRNDEGRIWKYGELVQYAEEKFAKTDGNAAIVRSTSKYKYSDQWHYDSDGYIDFGKNFAEEMGKLLKKN
jgi:hypothetical protein